MTAQFPDQFQFNGQDYVIAGIHGDAPFEPMRFGLRPIGTCTACWRGYVCTFRLQQNQLVLYRLNVNLGKWEENRSFMDLVGPAINGKEPALPVDRFPLFNNIYDGIDLPLQFSGGLLIARDFIRELYVHLGFHPAWKFHEVWELLFDDGILTGSQDVSLKVAELRKKLTRKSLLPVKSKDQLKWNQDTFRLDY